MTEPVGLGVRSPGDPVSGNAKRTVGCAYQWSPSRETLPRVVVLRYCEQLAPANEGHKPDPDSDVTLSLNFGVQGIALLAGGASLDSKWIAAGVHSFSRHIESCIL